MIADWLAARRRVLTGTATPIALDESREWAMVDGAMRHRTGGFFSLVGVQAEAPGQAFDGRVFPLIDQPEIGLLAFLTAPGDQGCDWLLQAKSEPGTTGWVQVGPTVQATRSNYGRKHGGRATLFLDHFLDPATGLARGLLHSEQGSRFLNKFNCNAVVGLAERCAEPEENWRWFPAAQVRAALAQDFAINTDSRSVITAHPWAHLRAGAPLFAGPSHADGVLDDLRAALAGSHAAPGRDGCGMAMAQLDAARAATRLALRPVPLDRVPGWHEDGRVDALPGAGGVALFRITAPQREVEAWDQPFMTSGERHRCGFVLADRGGVARLGFRLSVEPGFADKVQYGPSFQTDGATPAVLDEVILQGGHPPVLTVQQSDEGGRFLQVEMCYELHDLRGSDADLDSAGLVWLTLAEAEWLCRQSGALTNEARSALSVVLSLA